MTELLVDAAEDERATLVLAHGAGAPMDTPFMQSVARGLSARGIRVVRFEFPYMRKRREQGPPRPPDRMPILEQAFCDVVSELAPGLPLFVGGKSMGSRAAAQVAGRVGARGVVALGYPFHPPGRPGQTRLSPLQALTVPCLIIQGTRDPFGKPEEVEGYDLPGQVSLFWAPDGDHSLAPRKASGRTLAQNLDAATEAAASFILAQVAALP